MKAILLAVAAAVFALAPTVVVRAQSSNFSVSLQYYPDRTAAPYDLYLRLSAGIGDHVTFTSPNGTLFESLPGIAFNWHDLKNLTATDLSSYVGRWTISDYEQIATGAPPQQHTFDLSLAELTPPSSMPYFVSPAGNTILPPVFEVLASNGGWSLSRLTGSGTFESLPPLGGGPYKFEYAFPPGENAATFEARA